MPPRRSGERPARAASDVAACAQILAEQRIVAVDHVHVGRAEALALGGRLHLALRTASIELVELAPDALAGRTRRQRAGTGISAAAGGSFGASGQRDADHGQD